MSALLIKEAPEQLRQWLKSEALYNRRSVNQQVLVCLEWCMRTYGEARPRSPFGEAVPTLESGRSSVRCPNGQSLATRLAMLEKLDAKSAAQIKSSTRKVRHSKTREFSYGCFD